MFNRLEEIERFRERLDGAHHLEDLAKNLPKAAIAGFGIEELSKFERKRRCLERIGRILSCIVVIAAAAIVCNELARRFCPKFRAAEHRDVEKLDEDKKELIQKLAKIKGKTTH